MEKKYNIFVYYCGNNDNKNVDNNNNKKGLDKYVERIPGSINITKL